MYRSGERLRERLQRIVRERDLSQFCGLKRTQIAQLIANGEFPKPIKLSDTGDTNVVYRLLAAVQAGASLKAATEIRAVKVRKARRRRRRRLSPMERIYQVDVDPNAPPPESRQAYAIKRKARIRARIRARPERLACVSFPSISAFARELNLTNTSKNRDRIKASLLLWAQLSIHYRHWWDPSRNGYDKHVKRSLPPPIVDVEFHGQRLDIILAQEWVDLALSDYWAPLALPLPAEAAAQNVVLMAVTARPEAERPHRRKFCKKIGLRVNTRELENAGRVAADWFEQNGGQLLFGVAGDGRVNCRVAERPKIPRWKNRPLERRDGLETGLSNARTDSKPASRTLGRTRNRPLERPLIRREDYEADSTNKRSMYDAADGAAAPVCFAHPGDNQDMKQLQQDLGKELSSEADDDDDASGGELHDADGVIEDPYANCF